MQDPLVSKPWTWIISDIESTNLNYHLLCNETEYTLLTSLQHKANIFIIT